MQEPIDNVDNDTADITKDDTQESSTASRAERTGKMQAELDSLTQQYELMQAENKRKQVREAVQKTLTEGGLKEDQIRKAETAFNDYRAFDIDEETGEVVMDFAGVKVPIRDALPMHPRVKEILSQPQSTAPSAEQQRQTQISAKEKRLAEIQAYARREYPGPLMLAEASRLERELQELHAAAPKAEKKPGIADPGLILERKRLIADRDRISQEFRLSGGARNDLLVRASKLDQQIQELSRRISAQQTG